MFASHIPLLAALPLALAGLAALLPLRLSVRRLGVAVQLAALGSLALGLLALGLLLAEGATTSPLLGVAGIGLSARLDAVSVSLLILVSFLGLVVLRFSATYLDGEAGHAALLGRMSATLAAVILFVTAGNLVQLLAAWIATGLLLQSLLLFYPERIGAQRAARKRLLAARPSNIALAGAAALLWGSFGTTDIAALISAVQLGKAAGTLTPVVTLAVPALLAVAALAASAQFPLHGWLSEVMEAPTPVSALLHAGVINAGGVLLIRFADILLLSPGTLAALVAIGGFTALLGSVVMLTQPMVKTSLAWSTVAQMGFMILQCGLALFPLALLHILAHSLYKAHAFLASGTAVERVAAIPRPGPVAIPDGRAVARAFLLALAIYATLAVLIQGVVASLLPLPAKSPQALALGTILILGVAYLIAQGLADAAPRALTIRTSVMALAASAGYFALQTGAELAFGGALPAPPAPAALEWVLIVLAVASFGLVAIAQATFPLWAHHPAATGLRVHLANGLYVNALVDRAIGGWRLRQAPRAAGAPAR